jgi:hypothetical protein
MGVIAAFAGLLLTLEINVFYPTQGGGFMLPTMATVFVGGTSIAGGLGSIFGTFFGAYIIGSLEAGIVATTISGYWVQIVEGVVMGASMVLNVFISEGRIGVISDRLRHWGVPIRSNPRRGVGGRWRRRTRGGRLEDDYQQGGTLLQVEAEYRIDRRHTSHSSRKGEEKMKHTASILSVLMILALILSACQAPATPAPAAPAAPAAAPAGNQPVMYMQMGGTAGDASTLARTNGARAAAQALNIKLVEQYSGWDPQKMIDQFKEAGGQTGLHRNHGASGRRRFWEAC